jgi:hypothetical protein
MQTPAARKSQRLHERLADEFVYEPVSDVPPAAVGLDEVRPFGLLGRVERGIGAPTFESFKQAEVEGPSNHSSRGQYALRFLP